MHCSQCHTENPDQAIFCLACGARLVLFCSSCGTRLPTQARFCFGCGVPVGALPPSVAAALPAPVLATSGAPQPTPAPPAPVTPAAPGEPQPAPPSAAAPPPPQPQVAIPSVRQLPAPRPLPDMLPSLQRYLPQALYEPLERRPTDKQLKDACEHLTALLGTAKTYLPWPVVTTPQPAGQPAGGMYRGVFLFGDVSGFTPLSEKLKQLGQAGAEQIVGLINRLFTELVQVLFKHGGTLLKFGGDALLGVFPVETDDEMAAAVLRAAQAGLAMQAVMKQDQFAAIPVMGETRALLIKCGISAGPYFAAHIGTPQIMAYVTTGHTVNRAEQAEGHANPGEVVMTREAYDAYQRAGDPASRAILVGPVNKEPDENFCRVIEAPVLADRLSPPVIAEPPPGNVHAQITYLVDRLDRLSPYLPNELIARIVTNPNTVEIMPDHRRVTVMFANYVGVSDLIEEMGDTQPELIVKHLNDYFVHMAQIVEKYEGTLARMDQYAVGDRLVIFFGAPRAHEDDPVRAAYTALDMQKAVRDHFSALQTPTGIHRFRQRIGINTGHLFAGNVGAANLRQEYTLMGDDINMAARLMSKAGWQEVLVSLKTQEQIKAFFELEDRGEFKVKGKEILIRTFQVKGRREEIGRTRGLSKGDSPLVDRDDELKALLAAGQGLLNGRGQIVSIVGDSGLGKSRLVREFKSQWSSAADGARWVEGQALSFSEHMSYWLAVQMFRGALNLRPDANPDDTLFTLWETGEDLLGKAIAQEAVPVLAHVMDLPLKAEWAAWVKELDPKVRQKQTFWAARELFAAVARRRPTVIALDDLHWADEASLALIEDLLKVTDQAPLMFCLIFRPQRDRGCWRLRDKAAGTFPHRYLELTLSPLTQPQSQAMIGKLLPGTKFAPETLQEIFDKSAGNPFYLEEIVRSLINAGVVTLEAVERDYLAEIVHSFKIKGRTVQAEPQPVEQWKVTAPIEDIAVPDSLQGAIIARIDRLTEDARQALQLASVIGRRFQVEVLRSVVEAQTEMDSWMAQLERSNLLRPADSATDTVYAFQDALVQEVAYDSLLIQQRQKFHRRIGEALETIYAGRLEQVCEQLAYHFGHSDEQERAIQYLVMAGEKAQAEYALKTAIQHYSDLYAIQAKRGDQAGQADTLYTLGKLAYELGDYAEARPWLEQAVALRQALADPTNEAWSVMYLGMIDLKQGSYDAAFQHHRHALELARARQDTGQEGIHLTNLARVSMRLGAYEQALEQLEQSLEMKKQKGDLEGQGFGHYYTGLVYIYQDRYAEAEAALQTSLQFWQQLPASKNKRGIGYCLHGLGRLALATRQFAPAEDYFQQAYAISEEVVLKAEMIENLSFLGQARLGLAKLDEAFQVSDQAVTRLAEQKDVEEVQQIYVNHYHVLAARRDAAARGWLAKAREAMLNQAGRIADEAMRRTFLEKVKVNQEISACWQKARFPET